MGSLIDAPVSPLTAISAEAESAFLAAAAKLLGVTAPKAYAVAPAPGSIASHPGPVTAREKARAEAALEDELAKLQATTSSRIIALNNAALALGEFVGAGALDTQVVHDMLLVAAELNGYTQKPQGRQRAIATINSGLSAVMKNPRSHFPTKTTLRNLQH
jgi:hypothetical protein